MSFVRGSNSALSSSSFFFSSSSSISRPSFAVLFQHSIQQSCLLRVELLQASHHLLVADLAL